MGSICMIGLTGNKPPLALSDLARIKQCVFLPSTTKEVRLPTTKAESSGASGNYSGAAYSKGPVNRVPGAVVSGYSEFRAVVSGSSLPVIGAKEGQASADICNNSEEASDGPGSIPVYQASLLRDGRTLRLMNL